jgi:predicted Mrr-cat superfamily restriction endonuclease
VETSTSQEITLSSTEQQRVIWLVRSGEGGEVVDACVDNGFAAVGYPTVGDVRERDAAQVLQELRRATNRTDFETLAERLLDFATRMNDGDFVVTSDGSRRQLVVGRVSGPYEWRDRSPIPGMRHLRPVEWLGRIDWDDLDEDAVKAFVKYPRTVLQLTEPKMVALGDRAAAGDLLPVTPTSEVRRSRSTRALEGRSSQSDQRLCPSCFLRKHPSQFNGDAEVCVECAG